MGTDNGTYVGNIRHSAYYSVAIEELLSDYRSLNATTDLTRHKNVSPSDIVLTQYWRNPISYICTTIFIQKCSCLCSMFSTYSLFIVHCSLFWVQSSLFSVPCSMLMFTFMSSSMSTSTFHVHDHFHVHVCIRVYVHITWTWKRTWAWTWTQPTDTHRSISQDVWGIG